MTAALARHLARPPQLRVLCVDDEAVTLGLVVRLLDGMGLIVVPTHSPDDALRLFDSTRFDLVLTDIRMPGMDGVSFLRAIRDRDPQVPVVVATGHATLDNAMRCVREGASGMLVKPFTAAEFRNEIQTALERARIRHDALRYRFVGPILDGVALALTAAIEARHLETGDHCRELGWMGERVATLLGLDEEARMTIRIGGYLHDVGKIGIADAILLKPGALTDAEFTEMRRHAELGATIVETHEGMAGIAAIVRHHHERWDGGGYPAGLAGKDIPLGARIIAVADAFSAMTSDRVYRPRMPVEQALAELQRNRGTQFEGDVVAAFVDAMDLDSVDDRSQPQRLRVDPRASRSRPSTRISAGQI